MNNLNFKLFLDITTSFYEVATIDIMIGYHFRHIEDFDTHLPRIASFWQIQMTGSIDNKEQLPFNLLQAHVPLKIRSGEIDRWGILFEQTLRQYQQNKLIDEDLILDWMKKVAFFKERLKQMILF